jgi:regulator of chromosome condensation
LGESDIFESKVPRPVINLNSSVDSKVYKICCGALHTMILTTMGKVYTWGCADDGTLGRPIDGDVKENTPGLVQIDEPMNDITSGDCHCIVYNTDLKKIYMWGVYRVRLFINLEPTKRP